MTKYFYDLNISINLYRQKIKVISGNGIMFFFPKVKMNTEYTLALLSHFQK